MRLTLLAPGDLTPERVSGLLALVSIELAPAAMRDWSPNELAVVADWCLREHLRASDNVIRRRPRPALVALAGGRPIDPRALERTS